MRLLFCFCAVIFKCAYPQSKSESCPTSALIVIVEVRATTTIGTGFWEAQIHAAAATWSTESGYTLATILIRHIDAGSSILTHIGHTIINILFTLGTRESFGTNAFTI